MRRDRGNGPLPFRQADTRAVRRGPQGDAAAAARARFDAVEWVERKADKEGNIQIGSVRYLAGPSWRGWTLLAGLRAFEVEIRTADGRHVNTLPRSYGDGGRTAGNPATLLPALV